MSLPDRYISTGRQNTIFSTRRRDDDPAGSQDPAFPEGSLVFNARVFSGVLSSVHPDPAENTNNSREPSTI